MVTHYLSRINIFRLNLHRDLKYLLCVQNTFFFCLAVFEVTKKKYFCDVLSTRKKSSSINKASAPEFLPFSYISYLVWTRVNPTGFKHVNLCHDFISLSYLKYSYLHKNELPYISIFPDSLVLSRLYECTLLKFLFIV